jgi:hypothetical protein
VSQAAKTTCHTADRNERDTIHQEQSLYVGPCYPQAVNVIALGTATSDATIALQGLTPANAITIHDNLGSFLNFGAWDPRGGSVSVTASATSDAQAVTLNGRSSGSEGGTTDIDATIYLPTDHALVTFHLSDVLALNMKAIGFVGTVATDSNAYQSTYSQVGSLAPRANASHAPFNLSTFVASMLNSTALDIDFSASQPGQQLNVSGKSVVTIDADVKFLTGGLGNSVCGSESIHRTQTSTISYSANYGDCGNSHH